MDAEPRVAVASRLHGFLEAVVRTTWVSIVGLIVCLLGCLARYRLGRHVWTAGVVSLAIRMWSVLFAALMTLGRNMC